VSNEMMLLSKSIKVFQEYKSKIKRESGREREREREKEK